MSVCFKLVDKNNGEAVTINKVDEELCNLLGEKVSEFYYCPVAKDGDEPIISWYDTIGFGLACGKTYAELRLIFPSPKCIAIINYLEEHYVPENWYTPTKGDN